MAECGHRSISAPLAFDWSGIHASQSSQEFATSAAPNASWNTLDYGDDWLTGRSTFQAFSLRTYPSMRNKRPNSEDMSHAPYLISFIISWLI